MYELFSVIRQEEILNINRHNARSGVNECITALAVVSGMFLNPCCNEHARNNAFLLMR